MQHFLKSSSKLGLIAVVLLLASACGGESERDNKGDGYVASPSPLVDIEEIAAGDVCKHGGTMIINGVDKDGDGALSEDEIVSSTPVCKNAPGGGDGGNGDGGNGDGGNGDGGNGDGGNGDGGNGDGGNGDTLASPLIEAETLAVGDADCPNGGQRVIAGLDKDGDGELSAGEVESTTLLCVETALCSGVAPLELVNIEIEEDPFGQYMLGEEYEIRIELNQAIDKDRLKLKDITGSLGQGELAYEVDADNDHIAVLIWAPTKDGSRPHLTMAEDGCSLVADNGNLPNVFIPQPGIRVKSEAKGILNVGDTAEVCWTSRYTESCELFEFNQSVEPLDTEGCIDIELTQEQVDYPSVTIDYYIKCKGENADNNAYQPQGSAQLFKAPTLNYFTGQQPMFFDEDGGTVNLSWTTFGMESCTLSDGTETNPVPEDASPNDPHVVDITETTVLELVCEDAANQTYRADVRYLVGPGVLNLNGNMYAPGKWLSVSWTTIDVDGTCDVEYTNNGVTLEYNDIVQAAASDNRGFDNRNSSIYKPNIDTSVFDFTAEQRFDVTCYNADKSNSYSMTSIK